MCPPKHVTGKPKHVTGKPKHVTGNHLTLHKALCEWRTWATNLLCEIDMTLMNIMAGNMNDIIEPIVAPVMASTNSTETNMNDIVQLTNTLVIASTNSTETKRNDITEFIVSYVSTKTNSTEIKTIHTIVPPEMTSFICSLCLIKNVGCFHATVGESITIKQSKRNSA